MSEATTKVLVIAPHPDDAEFGVAGTVVNWVREGKEVIYAICTRGDKGTSDSSIKPEDLANIREEEQQKAADLLGVKEVVFLRYPDQGLEDTSEFRKDIVRLIRRYRPMTVVTADPYRRYIWHRDHRITGQVVLDAVFPFARDHLSYPDLLEEGLAPHKVREILFWGSEEPNCCFDITDTAELKLAALRCHRSQMKEIPSVQELEERLKERYKAMAEGYDFELGEAFHRVEILR
jgi:LmbE family N-acetylglucosaminyl deacetylase